VIELLVCYQHDQEKGRDLMPGSRVWRTYRCAVGLMIACPVHCTCGSTYSRLCPVCSSPWLSPSLPLPLIALLCSKGRDDLRQDAVMEQLFATVNTLLARDKETRRRGLRVRTYKACSRPSSPPSTSTEGECTPSCNT